ncbi:ribonuclease P/MRP subunit POP4 [Rhynchophorus ferrugineus]|uniref:Ribonuclease P protein subunit p29 n=1 Tax=Rhynchophorus ferrugineus TaxID=354439 RepID=A0A834MLU3_RHYFE|nr:hypothetical protein GWI33_001232 [Rhynchophorus ferrugineus]
MSKYHTANPFNQPLPQNIIRSESLHPDKCKEYLQNILKETLPASDTKNIQDNLKWNFIFDHHKLKRDIKQRSKKTFLTRLQRKELNLLKLPKDGWSYKALEPIRIMWINYMKRNLDLVSKAPNCIDQEWNSFSVIVAKSEMVGAEIKVVRSKVPSLIGMTGTVVLETKMTFQIVNPESKLKTILKETSVFEFLVDKIKFTFFGKHLMSRPADRSVRKIKNIMKPDL